MDLEGLDGAAREALAIDAAGLLRQCIGGLQQSLRTRSELKNELRLSLSTLRDTGKNPLRFSADAGEALGHLLRDGKPGQLSGEQAVARSFRDLQAHQVALLGASRAAVRATLEHSRRSSWPCVSSATVAGRCWPPRAAAGVPTVATTSRYARTTIGASVCWRVISPRPTKSRFA